MTTNPYMKRAQNRGKTSHGRASEQRKAKQLGATLTPASGAFKGHKGDMRRKAGNSKYLIEAKSTIHNTMSLELGWLVKISEEAVAHGSIPSLVLSFVNGEGVSKPMGDWVAIPAVEFAALLEKLEDL